MNKQKKYKTQEEINAHMEKMRKARNARKILGGRPKGAKNVKTIIEEESKKLAIQEFLNQLSKDWAKIIAIQIKKAKVPKNDRAREFVITRILAPAQKQELTGDKNAPIQIEIVKEGTMEVKNKEKKNENTL